MCNECNQSPHAEMCPNGAPIVDECLVDCALCGAEVDEETTTYGICEKCWTDHHNFDNAMAYGDSEHGTQNVKINGLFAKILTGDQINEALKNAFASMKRDFPLTSEKLAKEFLSDDDGDFADWLKEQKENE